MWVLLSPDDFTAFRDPLGWTAAQNGRCFGSSRGWQSGELDCGTHDGLLYFVKGAQSAMGKMQGSTN